MDDEYGHVKRLFFETLKRLVIIMFAALIIRHLERLQAFV